MFTAHLITQHRIVTEDFGLALIKLMVFTASSRVFFSDTPKPIIARASLCMLQCAHLINGATALILAINPVQIPDIALAQSVVVKPSHFDQSISFSDIKLSSDL